MRDPIESFPWSLDLVSNMAVGPRGHPFLPGGLGLRQIQKEMESSSSAWPVPKTMIRCQSRRGNISRARPKDHSDLVKGHPRGEFHDRGEIRVTSQIHHSLELTNRKHRKVSRISSLLRNAGKPIQFAASGHCQPIARQAIIPTSLVF